VSSCEIVRDSADANIRPPWRYVTLSLSTANETHDDGNLESKIFSFICGCGICIPGCNQRGLTAPFIPRNVVFLYYQQSQSTQRWIHHSIILGTTFPLSDDTCIGKLLSDEIRTTNTRPLHTSARSTVLVEYIHLMSRLRLATSNG
jgi:hypothetical protein